MKGPLDRTKVVLRHLPPSVSLSDVTNVIDSAFAGRYRLLAFRTGKSSQKHSTYARAYIDFNKPDDVIEFAAFFGAHAFVNEKGAQIKALVEYAPSQRVPKQWTKKDGREGTILKDPEYLEFLELLAKPVENLPSAEIQLERKEAERVGIPKDGPIITPLMDYVRQKRAAKGGARRILVNGKSTRRVGSISSRMQASGASKRGMGKRNSTTMYVLRDSIKGAGGKDKSTNLTGRKQDNQQLTVNSDAVSRSDTLEGETGGSGSTEFGKKKILLVKSRGKEISNVSDGSSSQQNATTTAKNSTTAAPSKQNQKREASGRIIKTILLNRDNRPNQPLPGSQPVQRIYPSNQEKDKRPPRPPSMQSFQKDVNGVLEDNRADNNDTVNIEKHEKRTRNKDRPDRGVWAPFRRSDGSHGSDESLSSSTSHTSQVVDSAEGTRVDVKRDVVVAHSGEYRPRGSHYSDSGSFRHGGRHASTYTTKDADGSLVVEGKPSKRGSGSGYGTHEKQVWVQKSSSGS